MPSLTADHGELEKFVKALFRYADPGTYASLRAFDQFRRDVPPEVIWPVQINGDLGKLVERAEAAIAKCGTLERSIVFAPPICTFTNPDRARGVDLANGLTLSVELDEGDTLAARRKLEDLLGPATVVVASGGDWTDQTTGEIHTKLHLHWRLSEPTRDQEDHAKLGHARDLAARLCGADPTGKPVVHPLRWPGSWNTKDKPRMARIAALNESAEVNLDEALEAVQEAVEAAGLASVSIPQSGTPEAPQALLESAMQAIPNPGTEIHYDQWIRFGYAAYRATGGSSDGYELWDKWSRKSDKYSSSETELAWARIAHAVEGSSAPRTIGAGTIFFYAKQAGWARPEPELGEPPPHAPGWWESLDRPLAEVDYDADEPPQTSANPPELPEGGIIDPRNWTAPAPLRQWIVQDWIPRGYVTGLYGDGGIGKSLLAQQLLTSVATAMPWLGMDVRGGPAFGFMCEDDTDELHRRQEAINRCYRLPMSSLELLRYASRVGFDNLLMTFNERNQGLPTPLFTEVINFLTKFRPALVVIDTVADTFGGDEIKRAHARQFVQGVGGNIARAFDCAVLFAAHPSAAGISQGTGTGGSTAWSNTFRSRLYLTADKDNKDQRQLSRMKANYAPTNADMILEWQDGCFQPRGAREAVSSDDITWAILQAIFDEITRAWDAGEPWSARPQTRNHGRYLPLWVFTTYGIEERSAASIIQKWMANGHIKERYFDSRTKLMGLKVIKQLQPPVGERYGGGPN